MTCLTQMSQGVHIKDPAVTLICSKNLIWLAVVQILDIHMDHTGVQILPTWLLSEPNVLIWVQLMCSAPVLPGHESDAGDWEWTSGNQGQNEITLHCFRLYVF